MTDPKESDESSVPRDHWRYLWDVRRFQNNESGSEDIGPLWDGTEETTPLPAGLTLVNSNDGTTTSNGPDDELHRMLGEYYVEDEDGLFRFAYSKEVMDWALFGPTSDPSRLHLRIIEEETGKLVAFLSATPMTVRSCIQDNNTKNYAAALIDFVCVVPSHRGKRLCPWMYQEARRRCAQQGIEILLCTSGDKLPTPVSSPQYFHLVLQPEFLVDCGFARRPPKWMNKTLEEMYPLLDAPPSPEETTSLREMTLDDVPVARKLLHNYMEGQNFALSTVFANDEDFAHTFLPRKDVVLSLVRENQTGITEFISFYFIDTLILGEMFPNKGKYIRSAYLFYSAPSMIEQEKSLKGLILEAAHILKNQYGVHSVNALPIMGVSESVLQSMALQRGTGILHHYFCNLPGVQSVDPAKVALFIGL